jgi:iron complex outermembrane receptor protein
MTYWHKSTLALLWAASIPAIALAQAAPAPANTPQPSGTVLTADAAQPGAGEIIVTALRRSDSILKTPAAITAITGGDLRARGVVNLSSVQNVAPSVNIASGRDGLQIAIRGVTTTDTSSKGEQDIAFSVDGVNIGRGKARAGAFFDVDRIEVLRGPQGTLYGRSSTGGAINVITNKPKLGEFSGYLNAEYGNYNTKRIEGAINIPLGDKVAFRASASANDRDGYSKPIDYSPTYNGTVYNFSSREARARNDQKDATGRFSLLAQPSDDVTLRLTATVGHQGGAGSAPALETELKAHHDTGSAALSILTNPVPAFLDNNFQQYDAGLNWKFGGVQLDVLGSYQHMHYRQQAPSVQDVAANGGGVVNETFMGPGSFGPTFQFYYQQDLVKTVQGEARLSNVNPGRVDWVAGVNYYRENAGENGQSWNALIDDPLDPSAYTFQAGPVNKTVHKAVGVFGQATFHLTDTLGIVGGVRYTHDQIARVGTFALPFNFAARPPVPYPDENGDAICHYPDYCVGAPNNGGARDNKVTWRAGINWQLDPRDLIYASVATGFKAGGFNDYDPATGGIGAYAPEQITAYEVGYKGRPFAGLTLSSSLFYYDFSKMQVNSGSYFPNTSTFALFTQAVPATIMGWENELSWRIEKTTTLDGSFTLLHSRFGDFQAGEYAFTGDPVSFTGRGLDLAPSFVVTAQLSHVIPMGEGRSLTLRAGTKYSAGYYLSDYADGVRYRQPHFTRSDASITYEFGDHRYSVSAFVQNIENKVQRTSMIGYANGGFPYGGDNTAVPSNLPANNLAFYTTDPRFFGVRASAKF